jgi:CubicO group peptidase (beta-lactamase class C family)
LKASAERDAQSTKWDKITIYHLLTHTSGIYDDSVKYEPGPPEKLLFRDVPLNFQPGQQWAYTNLGYIVLGYLLEKISGEPYEDFVRQNIFKPLAMNDSGLMSFVTTFRDVRLDIGPAVTGLKMQSVGIRGLGFRQLLCIPPLEDLLRWEEGLFGGRLLTPASLHKMTTPFRSDYACGLHVRVDGHLMIEHDGNNIGFNADMVYYLEEKIAVIVLANLNGTATSEMTKAHAAVAHGEAPPSVLSELPRV